MLELNNYYIQKVENLTDLFTIIFTIVDDIYNDIIPISIRNRRNIKDSKLCDSEIITISIVGELLTIDSEKAFFSLLITLTSVAIAAWSVPGCHSAS